MSKRGEKVSKGKAYPAEDPVSPVEESEKIQELRKNN